MDDFALAGHGHRLVTKRTHITQSVCPVVCSHPGLPLLTCDLMRIWEGSLAFKFMALVLRYSLVVRIVCNTTGLAQCKYHAAVGCP